MSGGGVEVVSIRFEHDVERIWVGPELAAMLEKAGKPLEGYFTTGARVICLMKDGREFHILPDADGVFLRRLG